MRRVDIAAMASARLGLLERTCQGDADCIAELNRAFLSGIAELRSAGGWVFNVESSVDPAAFDLYEPPLILTFIRHADGSLLVTSVRRT